MDPITNAIAWMLLGALTVYGLYALAALVTFGFYRVRIIQSNSAAHEAALAHTPTEEF